MGSIALVRLHTVPIGFMTWDIEHSLPRKTTPITPENANGPIRVRSSETARNRAVMPSESAFRRRPFCQGHDPLGPDSPA